MLSHQGIPKEQPPASQIDARKSSSGRKSQWKGISEDTADEKRTQEVSMKQGAEETQGSTKLWSWEDLGDV